MKNKIIPYAQPYIKREEMKSVLQVLKSGWLTSGKVVEKFENNFKDYLGCANAVAVSSATAALHISLILNNIGKGDEVITSPFTFASTANVIELVGATTVFCDIDYKTLNIDVNEIKNKITNKTKAIIVVHFAGIPCNIVAIKQIAERYKIKVIEDAAHALGSEINSRKIGSDSEFAAFSFYPIKNITAAEGGMLITNEPVLGERIKILRWYGLSEAVWSRKKSDKLYDSVVLTPGYKYNMTDIQAAIGIEQLKKLNNFNKIRADYAKIYIEELSNIEGIELHIPNMNNIINSWHLFVIRINKKIIGFSRDEFCFELKKRNIGSSYHYKSLHLHPYYKQKYSFFDNSFPNAFQASQEVISLPLYPKMKRKDIFTVIKAIKNICHITK